MEIIGFILIGLIAGWLAGMILKGGGYGIVGDVIVGILGGIVGGYLMRAVGATPWATPVGNIVVATLGAVLLIVVLRVLKRV